jgi:hypothetical protein
VRRGYWSSSLNTTMRIRVITLLTKSDISNSEAIFTLKSSLILGRASYANHNATAIAGGSRWLKKEGRQARPSMTPLLSRETTGRQLRKGNGTASPALGENRRRCLDGAARIIRSDRGTTTSCGKCPAIRNS